MTFQNANLPQASRSGFGMINAVEIKNYRGFVDFRVEGLTRINVVVGDNAVGKTAFLEAIWLTLTSNPQKSVALRQWRGMDIRLSTSSGEFVAEGMFSDIFHNPASADPVTIELWGDGRQTRRLRIQKTKQNVIVPVARRKSAKGKRRSVISASDRKAAPIVVPIEFTWRNHEGEEFTARILLYPDNVEFEGTNEGEPVSANLFAAQVPTGSGEAGSQYSALAKRRETARFRDVFFSVFDWITDVTVDSDTGALLADVPWGKRLLPVQALSGGTARAANILLAMAQREQGLVLIDEVEAGIYYRRQPLFSKAILEFSREFDTQVIATTHSEEWMVQFLDTLGDDRNDVTFWRLERPDLSAQPRMRRFTADEFKSGLSMGEMR